ncbi:MAG: hypothetical protein AVDCRST_MAG59-1019 [uncultured Thermomicrobiales bacterium]|jgi:ABC-2 type transport system permease protein|uniref:Uncharacterized protein n=1 Tax=uncultured Thermomicrobiales bacterium TaxID=1645740 RepID=A0A6J4UAD2_9BACT|nr:MAG: hypothetical protein AVDCRST_MAG59-1019 [uncultured Thermomicrobiales bacterium]
MSLPVPTAPDARYGEVYDRGYGHYEGTRRGRLQGVWALARWSMARALGLKKGWGSKVIPILLYVGALLPVVAVIGITAFVPAADVFGYADYFGGIFLLEGIFVATIAPEMMSPDRREGVLPLYFSRPISRPDYVVAKLVAAAILTLSISLLPATILWLGRQLLADAPLDAMRDNLGDLGRIAVAGGLIALYLGAIGLLISSFTGRKGVAVGVIVLGFLISEALSGALTFALAEQGTLTDWVALLSPTRTSAGLVEGLWPTIEGPEFGTFVSFPLWAIGAAMVAVVAVCCAVMFGRYAGRD